MQRNVANVAAGDNSFVDWPRAHGVPIWYCIDDLSDAFQDPLICSDLLEPCQLECTRYHPRRYSGDTVQASRLRGFSSLWLAAEQEAIDDTVVSMLPILIG